MFNSSIVTLSKILSLLGLNSGPDTGKDFIITVHDYQSRKSSLVDLIKELGIDLTDNPNYAIDSSGHFGPDITRLDLPEIKTRIKGNTLCLRVSHVFRERIIKKLSGPKRYISDGFILDDSTGLLHDIPAVKSYNEEFVQDIENVIKNSGNSNIFLYGPPGSGKTSIVHEVATRIGACIIRVRQVDEIINVVKRDEYSSSETIMRPKKKIILFEDILPCDLPEGFSSTLDEIKRMNKAHIIFTAESMLGFPESFLRMGRMTRVIPVNVCPVSEVKKFIVDHYGPSGLLDLSSLSEVPLYKLYHAYGSAAGLQEFLKLIDA